jgi:hypothetical protein
MGEEHLSIHLFCKTILATVRAGLYLAVIDFLSDMEPRVIVDFHSGPRWQLILNHLLISYCALILMCSFTLPVRCARG